MDTSKLDELRANYKSATEQWVTAIRAEEALATPDHSMVAMEHWDAADFIVKMRKRKQLPLGIFIKMNSGRLTTVSRPDQVAIGR